MRYFSMFSGIGGFELGIERTNSGLDRNRKEDICVSVGQETINGDGNNNTQAKRPNGCSVDSTQAICVGFSEIDKYATKIYLTHFPGHKNYGDATRIVPEELPDFDLLVGGFPCQAFSIAGKRLGFEDTRGTLFFDIARILKAKKPRNFVLENVKGLLSHDNGRTFKTIIAALVELGYDLEWQVLNSKNHGVPQNRERVFIVGHLGGIGGRAVFPIGTGHGEDFEISLQGRCGSVPRPIWTVADPESTRREIQSRVRIRRLTPTECERLQGFPDGWTAGISDSQRYKCLGNAVTVNVIEAIMGRLIGGSEDAKRD